MDTAALKGSVIVTGAARGIGAAISAELKRAGASVVIADIRDDEGAQQAAQLGGASTFVHLDVTDEDQWKHAVAVAESIGPLRALVNNAGIFAGGTIEGQPRMEFERVLQVNLVGPWLGMHAAGPALRRGRGTVVNISSTAGLGGQAGAGAYVASKWALRGLTKTAAAEFASDGVRVCSIHPSHINTPMTTGADPRLTALQPISRFGDPDEVARMVRFVVAEATYSTGCEFVVDGGLTAVLAIG